MFDDEFENESDPMNHARERVWTVSQVTHRVKMVIEGDDAFRGLSVRGEVTNLSTSRAGHIYFGLKDETSYLKCVAFKGSASRLSVKPTEGREVVATGRLNVWEAGGSYQLIVDELMDVGLGALWVEFEKTRKKLAEEGLFDEDIKRSLPRFPRTIGIVTSRDGAALRDMIRIFNDRAPYLKLIVSPSLVQGETAPESLIAALDLLEMWDSIEMDAGGDGLDIIIIGRGGGSFEDLACFNDERLVRRIRETRVPVISAVGHEVDFTIIDFASDVRAATPTQAAQIAAPSSDEILDEVNSYLGEFRQAAHMKIGMYRTGLDNILSRPVYVRPADRILNLRQNIDMYNARVQRAVRSKVGMLRQSVESIADRLRALDPEAILSRGYSLAFKRDSGELVTRTGQVSSGDVIDLQVTDGKIKTVAEEEK